MIPFLELRTQFQTIEGEVRAALDSVLDAAWFVLGDQGAAFESEFAEYLGGCHVVGVGSGTDAIEVALRALGIGAGDEVITAANTCVPTVVGICASGATPVLVDADPNTLTLDPTRLQEAMTPKTRAIVPVHLYGHACDMDAVRSVSDTAGVFVVEDCAQAHGTFHRDRMCGTLGDAAAFSFYPSKNLGAYGDGGAVVTRNAALADSMRRLRNYGKEDAYTHRALGVNSRLDEIQAAILRVKLRRLDEWNGARRERAEWYASGLSGLPLRLPAEAEWCRSCHHLYPIRTERRDALREHLAANSIATQIHYPSPIHLLEAYGELGHGPGTFPVAEQASKETLSLPLYPELSKDDARTVIESTRRFFDE